MGQTCINCFTLRNLSMSLIKRICICPVSGTQSAVLAILQMAIDKILRPNKLTLDLQLSKYKSHD